jgi:hypothetical protein
LTSAAPIKLAIATRRPIDVAALPARAAQFAAVLRRVLWFVVFA